MKNKAVIPLAVAAVMLGVVALAQGILTERFISLPEHVQVQSFVDRLSALPGLPMVIGDWVGEDQEMDDREREVAKIRGYISRNYTNQETGDTVSMMLVCGSFRHIAKHTPEMCYAAQGYIQEEEIQTFQVATVADTTGDFKTTVFKKENSDHGLERIRVFWTWNYDGQWVAPASARWSLRGRPALYKMYLISKVPPSQNQLPDNSPAYKFGRQLLPLLDEMLFDEPISEATATADAGS